MNQPLSGTGSYITPPPPHPDNAHAAALQVCAHARNTDDARLLLDALGLTEILHGARNAA